MLHLFYRKSKFGGTSRHVRRRGTIFLVPAVKSLSLSRLWHCYTTSLLPKILLHLQYYMFVCKEEWKGVQKREIGHAPFIMVSTEKPREATTEAIPKNLKRKTVSYFGVILGAR